MSDSLTPQKKLLLLGLILLTIFFVQLMTSGFLKLNKTYLNSDNCIYDPVFELIFPATK